MSTFAADNLLITSIRERKYIPVAPCTFLVTSTTSFLFVYKVKNNQINEYCNDNNNNNFFYVSFLSFICSNPFCIAYDSFLQQYCLTLCSDN